MKKFGLLLVTVCLAGFVSASTVDNETAERIQKIGSVCVEGEDCAKDKAAPGVVAMGGGAETNYKSSCATCHAIGVAGAPKLGDTVAWEPRLAKGINVLYQSALNGLAPGMPAKGMCFTCSDDELKAIVDYMVDSVK